MILKHLQEYEELQNWQLKKPATDLAWAEDVKQESLDLKFDKQLAQMKDSLAKKLPKVEKDLDKFNNWPQVAKYELTQQFEGEFYYYAWGLVVRDIIERKEYLLDKEGKIILDDKGNPKFREPTEEEILPLIPNKLEGKTIKQWVDEEFEDKNLFYTWKVAKIQQSIERIGKEQDLRARKVVVRKPIGTVYYIDSDNGLDTNAGTLVAPWKTLDKFCEAARIAGDKVIVRRGRATAIGNGSDLTFTSDGTIVAPLQIEADFDNVWNDFANSAQTYTTVFGSKTLTASANITGIAAGDWIYVTGDNAREFAYEVASVNGVTLTLYLPFKGTVGSGLTLVVMPDNPIWGTAAGDFQWNFDTDNYWKVQGIDIRGTDVNGQVEIDSCWGHQFIDCIFVGNGTGDIGIDYTDDVSETIVDKSRITTDQFGIYLGSDTYGYLEIKNTIIKYSGYGLDLGGNARLNQFYIVFDGLYLQDNGGSDSIGGEIGIHQIYARGITSDENTRKIGMVINRFNHTFVKIEDYQLVVGDNYQALGLRTLTADNYQIQSETTIIRAGGATKSIKVSPTTNFGTIWDFSKVQLFEIPIYLTTAQKTFTVYFNLPAANFTNAPTAPELWIELEAWGHAANNYRKITKSTGTVAKDGNWNALTITVAPAQAGVAYLRCYYCKTLEGGKDNIFYCDPLPVIS